LNSSQLKRYASIVFILFYGVYQIKENHASVLANPQNQLVHFPVTTAQEGVAIPLEVKLQGMEQIIYCRIYYRSKGEESYQFIEMDQSLEAFTGQIPAEDVKPPVIEYFISSVLRSKQLITSPISNPYYAPYVVNVTPRPSQTVMADSAQKDLDQFSDDGIEASTSSPANSDFMILSPEPGEIVPSEEIVIAVSLISNNGKIDTKSIRLYLDGRNVTEKAEIADGVISYVPKKVKSGQHRINLQYRTRTGEKRPSLKWRFHVSETPSPKGALPSDSKGKMFHGSGFIDLKNEAVSEQRLETYVVGGNLYGKYGFLKYHTKLYWTSLEKETSQPRNRYLIGVDGGWFGINLGDTNPRFNDLVLWGRRVRGFEAYIKTGFFNFEFVTGEIRRAVEGIAFSDYKFTVSGDTLCYNTNPLFPDTISVGPYSDHKYKPTNYEYVREEIPSIYGTYQRLLTGFRPSFGSGKNFQLGFNLVKVKDQVNSISMGLKPKDNVVFGPDLLLAFDNHRIELKTNVAFSILTDDIAPGPLTKAGIDTTFDTEIPFDPAEYEKYIILNTSTIPLDPTGMSSLAYNLKFRVNYFNNSLNIIYKSIGSEYNALGNSYLKTDIQGFSISDRLRLFKNRVLLSLGYDKYDDNFSKKDNNPVTDLSTFHVNAALFPANQLPKISFGYRSHSRNNGKTLTDNTNVFSAIDNTTNDLQLMLSYDVSFLQLNHALNFSLITSDRVDGFGHSISYR